jgi:hypothetical protein
MIVSLLYFIFSCFCSVSLLYFVFRSLELLSLHQHSQHECTCNAAQYSHTNSSTSKTRLLIPITRTLYDPMRLLLYPQLHLIWLRSLTLTLTITYHCHTVPSRTIRCACLRVLGVPLGQHLCRGDIRVETHWGQAEGRVSMSNSRCSQSY